MSPFPKKKPAVTVAIGVGKPKPGGMSGGKPPSFGAKPKSPMDDLEGPSPVEGSDEEESSESPDMESSEDSAYSDKINADIDAVGAEMGMQPAHARMAAGKFLQAIGKCLLGGDDQGQDDGSGDAGTIDTEGGAGPGRYGQ